MKQFSLIFCLCFFACQQQTALHRTVQKTNASLAGQTAPNDMIFVPGNGDIAPFYISISEEPNINYVIYLLWINVVWGESYPEVVKAALPKSPKLATSDQYIDAFVDAYLTNPAHAYHPITNLTWEQIENYLAWKTDRLNEYILIKNGILNFNPEQRDEDNFNTEAYLTGQYQGDVRKNLRSLHLGERAVKFNDGILFSGFRLPTEKEWDYVAANPALKKKARTKKKSSNFHPYGEDYYTLLWGKYLSEGFSDLHNSSLPIGINSYPIAPNHSSRRQATTHETENPFPSIYDFDPRSYGVINMENGVQEWLLNEYQDEVQAPQDNWLIVLKKGGITINNPESKDEEGRYVEKDSLGRLRHFRFIDVDPNGVPYEIQRYKANSVSKEKLNRQRKKILAQINKVQQVIKTQNKLPKDLVKAADELAVKRKEMIKKLQKDIAKIKNYYDLQNTTRLLNQLQQQEFQYNNNYQSQRLENLQNRLKELELNIKGLSFDNKLRQRLVKGGDWKNPGKQRRAMPENEAAANIGFRVILPYTGAEVLKNYKIKWAGALPKSN